MTFRYWLLRPFLPSMRSQHCSFKACSTITRMQAAEMKPHSKLQLALLLSVLLNVSTAGTVVYYKLFSPQRWSGASRHVPAQGADLKDQLGLTEEQWKQTEEIRKEFQKEVAPIWRRLKAKRIDLARHVVEKGSNDTTVQRDLSEVVALEAKLQKAVINHLHRQAELLDPSQRAAYVSYLREHLQRPAFFSKEKLDWEGAYSGEAVR